MELVKRVWDFSTSLDLLHDGDRVVIGVSGGPDSLCLLHVLHALSSKHRLELHVAHLNHGLRPEAAAEADFVRAEAERRGAGYFSESVDVSSVAQANKQSIEAAARDLRYAFLSRAAQRAGAHLVAVAHSADDQAETVLMHLLRGAGMRGLRGMLPRRVLGDVVVQAAEPVFLIRPLLQITRSEILAYCAENKLTPRFDASNSDVTYLRNRVRHELLTVMEAYNPNVRAVLARTAAAAAGDYEIWLEAVSGLWSETARANSTEDGQVIFDRRRWLTLSSAQQRALLRMAVGRLVDEREEIDYAPLDAAVQFSRLAAPGHSCQVAGGLVLRVEVENVVVAGRAVASDPGDWLRMVNGALAPGWRLLNEPLGRDGWSHEQIAAAPRWTIYVDTERLREAPTLRVRRPGDRFQPLGMHGQTVKLADYMVNQKIPVPQRNEWPLLTCGDDIVWVMGLRLDERYKVSPTTRSVTRLSVAATADE